MSNITTEPNHCAVNTEADQTKNAKRCESALNALLGEFYHCCLKWLENRLPETQYATKRLPTFGDSRTTEATML